MGRPSAETRVSADVLYRTAYETRNLEINLFWQRSNYYLVLSSGLAVGVFTLDSWSLRLGLCCFGLASSALWILTNLGSKFWQVKGGAEAQED